MRSSVLKGILASALMPVALLLSPIKTFATATVSTAAEAAISADLVSSGTYTTVAGPVLTEGSGRDIGTGTIVLTAPAGFAFDTSAAVTATVTRVGGSGTAITLSPSSAIVTTTTITITVATTDSNGSTKSRITWAGIRVRPTAATPLASGLLVNTGNASIVGLTSSSRFGTFTEVGGAALTIAFATQPGGAVAGSTFATQPVVVVQDQFGNTTSNGLPATLNVTMSLTSGAGPLQGTTTLNIGNNGGQGTARFTNLRIDVAGSDKQLTATPAATFDAVTSSVFAVSPGPASKLVILTQPSTTASAGVPFSQQPIIAIEDAFNNPRSNDTLQINAARAAGAGNLLGTTTVQAVGGIATYTDLAHPVATNITITFSSGSLTSATCSAIAVAAGPFAKLQVLVPGETLAPGSISGKSGTPQFEGKGAAFLVQISGVDNYWNLTAAGDTVHLSSSDSAASLPSDTPLNNGQASLSVTLNTLGAQTVTASDISNSSISAATSSTITVAIPGPTLPAQQDRALDELTRLVVTNSATDVSFSGGGTNGMTTNSIVFNYSSRTALLADGWSFIATNPDGTPRNTEITNSALGGVVNYNQSTHAGQIQVPCDLGDLWGAVNTSRNSLFRSLPAGWTSLQLSISFAPRSDFQQTHLALYQDDDNYIQAGIAFNTGLGGEISTLVWELGGVTDHNVTIISLVNTIRLRLDRDLGTGTITGYYSLNGTTWNVLGSQNIALSNPRLAIWVGGSPVQWTSGMLVCGLQRLDVISTNGIVPTLSYRLVNPPAGALINGNGIITWTPGEVQGPSTNSFTTIVTDSAQLSATNTFAVVVNEVNAPPQLPSQINRVSVGQSPIIITNTATDPDLPANHLTYSLAVAPSGASIDTNGVIFWTPSAAQVPSTNVFTTVVTDYNPWALTAQQLSATNSFTIFVTDQSQNTRPTLSPQPDQTIDELATLLVTNSASSGLYASVLQTNSYTFNYSSRSSLLSAGWSFIATNPNGTPRNTEITNTSAGAVASYNQTTHPNTLWIPCDLGDIWSFANNTRNSLFRAFPAGWTRAQVSLGFAPNVPVQQAHLVMYQDDDNWVAAGLAWNGGLVAALDQETLGSPNTLNTVPASGTNAFLRLDRNSISGDITALYSTDGSNWTSIGSTSQTLTNTRLCVWVGGSPYPYTNGMPNGVLRRVDVWSSNTVPSVLSYQLVNPPSGATIDAHGLISWTPSEAQGPSTNTFTTIVSDNGVPVLKDTNSFRVFVNELNQAPLLPVLQDQTLVGVTPLTVTNTATDLDLPANSLSYQLTQAPATAAIDSNGTITWAPSAADVPSTNLFTTVVTDSNPWAINSQQLSATNSFYVFVTVDNSGPPPTLSITFDPAGNNVSIAFTGPVGASYQIQWTDDLSGAWNLLATVTVDASGQVQYQAAAPNQTGAFFRVQQQ